MSQKRGDDDFRQEILAHIEIETDRLVEQGIDRETAAAQARRAFGSVMNTQERFYEARHWVWFEHLFRAARQALREMKSSPISTATIVLSLAFGIGFSTAIFSLADQALLRTLPVQEPDRLVQLDWKGRFVGTGMGSIGYGSLIPYPLYRDLRAENDVFTEIFGRSSADVHLTLGGESQPASVELVTGSFFPALGVKPALGRLLATSDDQQRDGHPVLVLSYDFWQSQTGGDPNIVGQTVRINGYPMSVVGVAEAGFRGMDNFQTPAVWVPMMMKRRVTPALGGLDERRARFMHVFGRLKPGVGVAEAKAQLQPWFKAYLEADTQREGWPLLSAQQSSEYLASTLDLLPGGQGDTSLQTYLMEQPILILVACTSLILLLACLNVANLSLARALARRRTIALRSALGASRWRIVAERLVESAMIAGIGCLLGTALASPLIQALLSFLPQIAVSGSAFVADLDLRVLAFAIGITAFTTVLCGVGPALYAASVRPVVAIKEQAAAVAGGLGLRKALVVAQFALALLLLIGAGLFARTLGTLRAQGPGFSTNNLLMFRVSPINDGYAPAEGKQVVKRLLAGIRSLPDVANAGALRMEMLRLGGWNNAVTVDAGERIATKNLGMNAVTPGLFSTFGVRITRGRDFDDHDDREGNDFDIRSAIVNEEFVQQYLPNRNPIGARIGFGDEPGADTSIEIVGVVSSFHNWRLREAEPLVFFPMWEVAVTEGTFYVRSRSSSEETARSLRAAVARIDPALTVYSMRTIDHQLDRLLNTERLLATLAITFASVATFLAMIGLYGVLSFSAVRRTREIGIRLALGSSSGAASGLIVREAAWLAMIGAAIAIPSAWLLGRFVESQLFGVRPMDAPTIGFAAGILVAVCLVAAAIPARKAGRVDPLTTLRAD